eukprot:gene28703-35605_t
MGDSPDFEGAFYVKGFLSSGAIEIIQGLGSTRRMHRDSQKLADRLGISLEECLEKYLADGQLYCGGSAWIEYLIDTVIVPAGCALNGRVDFKEGDEDDRGFIKIKNNVVVMYLEHEDNDGTMSL